ncbi:hypothetical protein BJI61_15355 [Acinetobacter baumannii]|nr:hypothetical protein BJI61_15355 [Acinetobacter baumannii]RQL68374.1 hypothetical protein BJI57_06785 [Acinetobacter baumannii]
MGKALLIKGSKNNHLSLKGCFDLSMLRLKHRMFNKKKRVVFLYILVSFNVAKLKKQIKNRII